MAAAYALGMTQNHPFVDENKRTAFVSATTFLLLNSYEFNAPEGEVVTVFQGLAAGKLKGKLKDTDLVDWFQQNSTPNLG